MIQIKSKRMADLYYMRNAFIIFLLFGTSTDHYLSPSRRSPPSGHYSLVHTDPGTLGQSQFQCCSSPHQRCALAEETVVDGGGAAVVAAVMLLAVQRDAAWLEDAVAGCGDGEVAVGKSPSRYNPAEMGISRKGWKHRTCESVSRQGIPSRRGIFRLSECLLESSISFALTSHIKLI